MTPRNFLVVSLCDNDFGMSLEFAAKACQDVELDELWNVNSWKIQMVAGIVAHQLIRRRLPMQRIDFRDLQRTQVYLWDKIKVTYEQYAPTADHDGGSLYIDMHLNTLHRY